MDGSFLSPPAKRSKHRATGASDANSPYGAANGASFKRPKPPPPPLTVAAGDVCFRLLCHESLAGGVIGKSGTIIKQLQKSTASKIRVEESPPGVDERIIVIIASSSVKKKIALNASKEEEEGSGVKDEVTEASAAQKALIRVFERILDVAAEIDSESVAPGSVVSCRLLADSSQMGSVIGKGGKVIEKIRKDTGCKIRIVSTEMLPACVSPEDEMVEIEGNVLAVKKALISVSRCLQDRPPIDREKTRGSQPLEVIAHDPLLDLHTNPPPQRSSALQPMPVSSLTYASGGRPVSIEAERMPTLAARTQHQEVVFRLLCSNDKAGGVIGKGGKIVMALQNETGASISVEAPLSECGERLITISAMENPESQYSPAQNAVVLVFNRSVEAGIEKGLGSAGLPVYARLVVPSNQIGCLLGKGGIVISEIRNTTGAGIEILGRDQVPKCALQNDEVVQITGELFNVKDALYNVTGRLRENLFSSSISSGAGIKRSYSVITEMSPYERARDPSSLGLHTSYGVSHNLNMHTPSTQSIDHLGLPYNYNRPPSPRLWASQYTATGVNPRRIMDVGRGLNSVKGGLELGSGNRSAIVTNTTMELLVPEHVIGSVYGENGSNLARLRQISGAKVVLHEPRPGSTDVLVVISGTPEETHAAQSLLQAFILTGPS